MIKKKKKLNETYENKKTGCHQVKSYSCKTGSHKNQWNDFTVVSSTLSQLIVNFLDNWERREVHSSLFCVACLIHRLIGEWFTLFIRGILMHIWVLGDIMNIEHNERSTWNFGWDTLKFYWQHSSVSELNLSANE